MASEKIRIEHSCNFTMLSNDLLRDKSLSLKAKGALCVMLSLPGDWEYNAAGLAAICNVGRDSMRSILRELEAAGYLVRRQTHSAAGTFAGSEYVVSETKNPPMTENPATVKPSTDYPTTENPAQLSKDSTKDRSTNTPHKPPMRTRRAKADPVYCPHRFEQLWQIWPGGGSRAKAVAAWDKLAPDDALIDTMAHALKRQMASEQWQRGIGIPHLSTWLNGSGWRDKVQPRPPEGHPPDAGGWAPDPEVTS